MLPIAWITFRRITERSMLGLFAVLAFIMVLLGLDFDVLIPTSRDAVENSCLGVIWTFLGFVTLFSTCIEIPREVARQEVHVYLSKPVTRLRYMLGKYLGMAALLFGGQAFLIAVFVASMLLRDHQWLPSTTFWIGSAQTTLFLFLLAALCMPISLVLPGLPSLVAVLIIVGLGYVSFSLPVLAWAAFYPGPRLAFMAGFYTVPNLIHYRWPLHELSQMTWSVAALIVHTAAWAVIGLVAAHVVFRGRDLH